MDAGGLQVFSEEHIHYFINKISNEIKAFLNASISIKPPDRFSTQLKITYYLRNGLKWMLKIEIWLSDLENN